MDAVTAKKLLQSKDLRLIRTRALELSSFESDDAKLAEQVLKLQLMLWTRVMQLQETSKEKAESVRFMAVLWTRMGEYERAVGQLVKSLALDPENIDTIQALGDAYANNGDYASAIQEHNRAIRMIEQRDDQNALEEIALAHCKLAAVYEVKGELTSSMTELKMAEAVLSKDEKHQESSINAIVHGQIGTLFEKMGQYDEAVEAFQQAYQVMVITRGEDDSKTKDVQYLLEMAMQLAEEERAD